MNKRNFTLIQGGKVGGLGMASKGKAFQKRSFKPQMTFVGATATTTRLMGVVGVVAHYLNPEGQPLTQVLHLDYEEYGIDGYQLFADASEAHIEREISKIAGGLGGEFVEISYDQYRQLVHEAYLVDPNSIHVSYDIQTDFPELLWDPRTDRKAYDALLARVGPEAQTDYEILNYGLMRMTGLDHKSFAYLSDVEVPSAWYQEVTSPGTLLKNTITEIESMSSIGVKGLKTYRCEALIDHIDRYKLMHLQFQIADTLRGRKLVGIQIEGVMNISAYEASFQLRKREHLAIYEIMEEGFLDQFEELHPEMMVNGHGAGDLFTEFNVNNEHVNRAVYYLSGDVFANYFITDEEQMVVCSFELTHLDAIDHSLSQAFGGALVKMGEMTADQSILYDFVTSGYGNLYAYLDDTQS